MKFVVASSLLLALLQSKTVASNLRGAVLGKGLNTETTRRLEITDFIPLACNVNLDVTPCVTWSSKFGVAGTQSRRITIPCGECVTMDHTGNILTLNGGMDIHGKLEFPDNDHAIEVVSTMIAVQGELHITSTKPVDGKPLVTLTMIGQEPMTFTPIGENANKCDRKAVCDAGKKAIVVAGGKVDCKYTESAGIYIV